MKKDRHYILNIILIFILLFLLATLTGCSSNYGAEIKTSNTNIEDTVTISSTKILVSELYKAEKYNLYSTKLLPNSKLLLCYLKQDSNICQFRIYDLKSNIILSESREFLIDKFSIRTLTCLNENFYILSNQTCYVFNFDCELVRQINIPIDISATFGEAQFWLSNDLKKIIYVDNPDFETEYLYISDINGQNKEQIRLLGEELTITDLFFSTNSKRLGFEGVTIPYDRTTSIECYGYIDLDTFKTTMFVDEQTFIAYSGDVMIIQYKTANYGTESNGIIKTLDLSTTYKNEFKMDFYDECESASVSSDGDYLVGMHKDYENESVIFNIYYKGKTIKSLNYECLPEQNYWDFVSTGTEVMVDIETNQIIVFYYDTDKMGYAIMSFEF